MIDREDAPSRELYLLRHADAGDPGEWRGDDNSRPLSDKGRRQASALGRFLGRRGFVPDVVLSSPRMRARQTAEFVAVTTKMRVELDDRLAGPLDLAMLEALLAEFDGRRLLLVGHDPELSELAATLIGCPLLPISKGTLVRIDVSPPLHQGHGRLRWLLPPELVG